MIKKLFNRSPNETYIDPANEEKGAQGLSASVLDLILVHKLYNNVLYMKDGSFKMIVKSGAVNLDLKPHNEQLLLLNTFGELLNALDVDFPMQVLLHASYLDTARYTRRYKEKLQDPSITPEITRAIVDHLEYFELQARENHLLDRSFYFVIPFFGIGRTNQLGDTSLSSNVPGSGFFRGMLDNTDKEKGKEPLSRDIEYASNQLNSRASLIIGQLSRFGIPAQVLNQIEIVNLLRELYNPGISQNQKLTSMEGIGSILSMPKTVVRERQLNRGGENV